MGLGANEWMVSVNVFAKMVLPITMWGSVFRENADVIVGQIADHHHHHHHHQGAAKR